MTQEKAKTNYYPTVEANPDFVALEYDILAFWKREGIFQKSVDKNRENGKWPYVFYDGPPFANGLPHYGHLLTGYVKDLIARYQTMRGKRVERRFGWDCHGLPAEMGAEKELGISGRQAIIEYGIGKFNEYCKNSVMKYAGEWERYVNRQGRWVDFRNDYKTMDRDFMESVLWAFSELHKKGLIYESYRVMPYSWAAETPLSNFEIRLDNATREREDKAITVAFELNERPAGAPEADKYYLLAWTTTPWTLPGNLALAVHPGMEYACFLSSPLAGERASNTRAVGGNDAVVSPPTETAGAVPTPPQGGSSSVCYICSLFSVNKVLLESYGLGIDIPEVVIVKPQPEGSVLVASLKALGKGENRFAGEVLLNLTYKPLFPYFADRKYVNGSPLAGKYDAKPSPLAGEGWVGGDITPPLNPLPQGEGKSVANRGYPEHMTGLAKDLRGNPTEAEKKLWCVLKDEQLGYKFRRQQPIGNYIVDFYNAEKRLVIEVDGGQHAENAKDEERTKWLEAQGLKTLRFWNNEVLSNMEGVLAVVQEALKNTPHAVSSETAAPPQGGSSKGAFCILDGSEFIEVGSGTGVVHLAPGFGEDDQKTCEKNGISVVCPVDDKGRYTEEVFDIEVPGVGFQVSGSEDAATRNLKPETLRLKGLNVIADTRKDPAEPYTEQQLAKYGLANLRIIHYLKQTGQLIKQEDFKHNYPHCWRTDTPIIYRALPSWYVKVSAFKDRAVELNKRIHWIPEHTRDGAMGHMLASAPDWSISRNRFWGCPIPVWRSPSGKIKVFGSIAELEAASGQKIEDLHRPFIDEIIIREGGEDYRRVEEVLDCWFESGSMPYASQWSEIRSRKTVDADFRLQTSDFRFPADFITEYIGQTRGWFNTLMMLATALFDQEPFKHCICHGVVIDEETGLKYSKRLKNYKDPMEVFDMFGADALRWLMVSSGVMRGHDLGVDPEGKFIRDVVRLHIKPIWNAYNFFTLYANADGMRAEFSTDSENVMDQYILAKCAAMVEGIQSSLDGYDTPGACEAVSRFVEVLNNWYIRRSRPRFWGSEKTPDKQAAYNTLYTVLHTLCRAAAPLLPFTLEAVYCGLCSPPIHERSAQAGASGGNAGKQEKPSPLAGEGWVGGKKNTPPLDPLPQGEGKSVTPPQGGSGITVSVHLQDFPKEMLPSREEHYVGAINFLDMDKVRDICNAALSIRSTANIRTRQPLSVLTVYAENEVGWGLEMSDYYKQFIMDELNVKEVLFSRDLESVATKRLEVNSRRVGKRLPKEMKQLIPASKKGEWKILEVGQRGASKIEIAGVELFNLDTCDEEGEIENEFSIKLESKIKTGAAPLSTNDALVVLDLTLTPELIAEGMARDVVRMVQESRRRADLHISDRIALIITAPSAVQHAVTGFRDYIAGQVLAESVAVGKGVGDFSFEHEWEGEKLVISFSKVSGSGFQVSEKKTPGTRNPEPETLGKAL